MRAEWLATIRFLRELMRRLRACADVWVRTHQCRSKSQGNDHSSNIDLYTYYSRLTRQVFLGYRFVCKIKECVFNKLTRLVVLQVEESMCVPKKKKKPIYFQKKANNIDKEKQSNWCWTKPVRTRAIVGPLGPWWHARDDSMSRLDFSVLARIRLFFPNSPRPKSIFIVCISMFACTRRDSQRRHMVV
jgi:hypothetical protein